MFFIGKRPAKLKLLCSIPILIKLVKQNCKTNFNERYKQTDVALKLFDSFYARICIKCTIQNWLGLNKMYFIS